MLTFLNTAVLVGLAAVAIPILIHLFTRQKTKLVDFSTLRFLKELQNQQIRRLKIRQILLLILRALLILFLVLAFSRPALRSTSSSALESGAHITAVIILDNTLSMGRELEGQTVLDAAKQRAINVLNLMRPGDEIHLLYPQDPLVSPHSGARYNLESMRELIEDTELSYGQTNYLAALSLAETIMARSTNINKEVYLIGDLQKNGFELTENGHAAKWLSDGTRLLVLPVSNPKAQNLAVADARLANQILERGKVIEVEAVIKNNSASAVQNKLVHLFMNGKRVAQTTVDLAPHSSTNVALRMVPDRSGLQTGMVLLEDDDLLGDNRRYLTFYIPDEIPVLMVGRQSRDIYFLTLALRPEKDAASIKIKEIQPHDFAAQNLDDYAVVIFSNLPELDNIAVQKIQTFVGRGGGLMVFLGADVDLRSYNEHLHRKLNLPLLTQSLTRAADDQFLSFGKIDFSHPIFKDVFESEQHIDSPHFRFAINVEATKPIDKIIEFGNGAPFLFESKYQNGRIMYFTSGVSSDWSDLTLRGIFAPLINRCVSYLANATSNEKSEFIIGEEIGYYPEGQSVNTEIKMQKPDGSEILVKPEVLQGKYHFRFRDTNLPGIYQLFSGENVAAQWAVNFDPHESELTELSSDDVKRFVGTEDVFVIKESEGLAERLYEFRFGRELWKYFAATALMVLLLEMLLFREKAETQRKAQKIA